MEWRSRGREALGLVSQTQAPSYICSHSCPHGLHGMRGSDPMLELAMPYKVYILVHSLSTCCVLDLGLRASGKETSVSSLLPPVCEPLPKAVRQRRLLHQATGQSGAAPSHRAQQLPLETQFILCPGSVRPCCPPLPRKTMPCSMALQAIYHWCFLL